MKILFVADGRSPITIRWLKAALFPEWRLFLISTFPCQPIDQVTLAGVLPVAFSALAGSQVESSSRPAGQPSSRMAAWRPLLQKLRYIIGPMTIPFFESRFKALVREYQPDLVHALRIPYEGMLAACLPAGTPLLLSTWGNDLTLHARGSLLMESKTRRALLRAQGLFSDTLRDIRLARSLGLRPSIPAVEVPGNAGLDLEEIKKMQELAPSIPEQIKNHHPIIINPRGFRPGSVHQDVFFQAAAQVVRELPDSLFICTGMQGQSEALRQVETLGLRKNTLLLPYLSQADLWNLFQISDVYVSLSSHDGTPNTLLEAMTFGCLPVCGGIESIREWITDGENGLLVDALDAQAASQAIQRACRDITLQRNAKKTNREIIRARADLRANRQVIRGFYQSFQKKE
jgi:hypothetical protein